ncbi:hypothetical protein HOY82DRAFT_538311 [Tuber indicum]|nr:hypothetical protein HOY82DRAFT_538311 [Tuber indicum]
MAIRLGITPRRVWDHLIFSAGTSKSKLSPVPHENILPSIHVLYQKTEWEILRSPVPLGRAWNQLSMGADMMLTVGLANAGLGTATPSHGGKFGVLLADTFYRATFQRRGYRSRTHRRTVDFDTSTALYCAGTRVYSKGDVPPGFPYKPSTYSRYTYPATGIVLQFWKIWVPKGKVEGESGAKAADLYMGSCPKLAEKYRYGRPALCPSARLQDRQQGIGRFMMRKLWLRMGMSYQAGNEKNPFDYRTVALLHGIGVL